MKMRSAKTNLSSSALSYLESLEQSSNALRNKPKPRKSISEIISQARKRTSASKLDADDISESLNSSTFEDDSARGERVLVFSDGEENPTPPSSRILPKGTPGAQVGRKSLQEIRELRNSIDQSLIKTLEVKRNVLKKEQSVEEPRKEQKIEKIEEVEEKNNGETIPAKTVFQAKSPFKKAIMSESSDAESIIFDEVFEEKISESGKKVSSSERSTESDSEVESESDSEEESSSESEKTSEVEESFESESANSDQSSSSTIKERKSESEMIVQKLTLSGEEEDEISRRDEERDSNKFVEKKSEEKLKEKEESGGEDRSKGKKRSSFRKTKQMESGKLEKGLKTIIPRKETSESESESTSGVEHQRITQERRRRGCRLDHKCADNLHQVLKTVIDTHVKMINEFNEMEWKAVHGWKVMLDGISADDHSSSANNLREIIRQRLKYDL